MLDHEELLLKADRVLFSKIIMETDYIKEKKDFQSKLKFFEIFAKKKQAEKINTKLQEFKTKSLPLTYSLFLVLKQRYPELTIENPIPNQEEETKGH